MNKNDMYSMIDNEPWTPTPLFKANVLSDLLNADIWLKREDCTPVKSFKIRGALSVIGDIVKSDRNVKKIVAASAGNYGFEHAGDPGIWATEVNSNGDLILGGKMVIVGNWDGVGVSGNKAGHVCLDINTSNNTCNDEYRISDFYILAPGNNIYSTITNNEYVSLSGTSMSAPHVTGAFGILNQMWPYMKGENLVQLVLNSLFDYPFQSTFIVTSN